MCGLGLVGTRRGLRLVGLSRDGKLRLWSWKDGQERACVDLAADLLGLEPDELIGDERWKMTVTGRAITVAAVANSLCRVRLAAIDVLLLSPM